MAGLLFYHCLTGAEVDSKDLRFVRDNLATSNETQWWHPFYKAISHMLNPVPSQRPTATVARSVIVNR